MVNARHAKSTLEENWHSSTMDKNSSFGANFDRVSCELREPENQGLIKQERKKDVFKQLHHRSLQLLSSPCLHRRVSKVKS